MGEVTFRWAEREDCGVVLSFIRELAEYEKMSDEVVATEEVLSEWLFDKKAAEAIIVSVDGQDVGFALFFSNFSTFLGKPGLYLEDLYVKPEFRGRGIGKATLAHLAAIAEQRGYGRFEWWCLDWNKPSIDFYRSLGAEPMADWTVYRMTGDTLHNLAAKDSTQIS
jgi:GNAT superfamily N-acetyltransferase